MAVKHDLSVMVPLLLGAAVLQDMQPVLPRLGGKVNWLAAVVLYYALARERHLTMLAAVVAGVCLDALGGLPMGGSAVFFVWMAVILARFRAPGRPVRWRFVLAAGALVAPLMGLYQYALLRMTGYQPLEISGIAGRILAQGLSGMAAAGLVFLLGSRLDRALANPDGKRRAHG